MRFVTRMYDGETLQTALARHDLDCRWVMQEIGDVIPLPYPEEQQPYRGMLYIRREDRTHHDWTPDLHDASAVGDTVAPGFTGFTSADFAY